MAFNIRVGIPQELENKIGFQVVQFGGGTGKLKLAYVYDLFTGKFPKLQAIIPYRLFCALVDAALITMRAMIRNEAIGELG